MSELVRTRICVLGPPRISRDDGEFMVRGLAARLLCHLAAQRNSALSAVRLIDLLWDEPPPTAKTALQVAVHKLRTLLEPDRSRDHQSSSIKHSTSGYRLDLTECDLDIELFESALAVAMAFARSGAWSEVSSALERSLPMWDQPFGIYSEEPELFDEADRLDEVMMLSQDLWSEAGLRLGTQSVERLQSLAYDQPLRERRWEHLMLGLYREGRQVESLRAFESAAATLETIGVCPGPRLVRLEERILTHDPALLSLGSPGVAV